MYTNKSYRKIQRPGMVAHVLNSSNWRQSQADLREFKVNLVYLVSSR